MKDEDSTAWLDGFVEIRREKKRFADLSEEDLAWLSELYKRARVYKKQGLGENGAMEAARKELEEEEDRS
jgi:hypothetical protein